MEESTKDDLGVNFAHKLKFEFHKVKVISDAESLFNRRDDMKKVVIVLLVGFMATGAFASNFFQPATGNWNVDGNWSNGYVPLDDGEEIKITEEASVCTVDQTQLLYSDTKVSIASGPTGTTLEILSGGYLGNGREFRVGSAGSTGDGNIGFVNQSGGTLEINENGKIFIGYKSGGTGTYTISGGSLLGTTDGSNVGRMYIGCGSAAGSVGTLIIQGTAATIDFDGRIYIASDSSSSDNNLGTGTLQFNLSGGAVSRIVADDNIAIDAGGGGTASLIVNADVDPTADIILVQNTTTSTIYGAFDTCNGGSAAEGATVILGGSTMQLTYQYDADGDGQDNDIALVFLGGKMAHTPVPANDETVDLNLALLDWVNPSPEIPGNPVYCDVYLGTESNRLNMDMITLGDDVSQVDINTANFPTYGVLQDQTQYYWAVDSYDGQTMYPGVIWFFETNPLSDQQKYLRITEIMYYPDDPVGGGYTADEIEFIELKNIGETTLTLDDAAFTAGIEYTFPASTTLDPNGNILVVKDPCSFALEYLNVPDGVQILGPYTGQLADEGETLTLQDSVGGTIHSFAYGGTWYDEAAGDGSSLVIIDWTDSDVDNWASRSSWAYSPDIGGSPGEDDFGLEQPADLVTIESVTLKANKDRDSSKDSISISGSGMEIEEDQAMTADTLFIGVYNADEDTAIFSEEIDADLLTGSNYRYSYRGSAGISQFQVDMNAGTFSIVAKNIDLSGLGSPLAVELEIGDYLGIGIAAETEEEYLDTEYEGDTYPDVINGTKPIPILLLKGEANGLQLTKAPKLKQVDTKTESDSLSLQGGIAALNDTVNLTNEEVVIEWGDYSVTVPAGGLVGSNGKYTYKLKDTPSVSVQIDLVKCTFKIQIKKADIPDQGISVDLTISWDGFDETVTASGF